MRQKIVALPANTDTVIAGQYASRLYLAVMNVGLGNANLSFGPGNVAVVDQGWPLDAASAAGRQGGGVIWGEAEGRGVNCEVHAISAAGTTLIVLEN